MTIILTLFNTVMGNQRNFLESGGFSEYLYETVGEVVTINGLRCKIIKMPSDTNNHYAGLPKFSNTSDIYVGLGPGDVPRQLRVYKDRRNHKDFDWGHEHINSDETKFPKGVVHVQRYPGANDSDARYMTSAEHQVLDAVISYFAPFARLTP